MVWNNAGRNITLDRSVFTDMGSLSRNFAFKVAALGVRRPLTILGLVG